MIIGDFNIDIMCCDNISHEFLNNFSEKEYVENVNSKYFLFYKIFL